MLPPWGCHGADDAYARIYGYFKRQLARVSVRAAMLVRLRALDVVLGRSPRPESLMDRKEAKRAKATRLAAVDVVSESDSCGSRQLWRVKGLAQPFESLHQVQIIPRGSCFYFLWVFACIFPLDSSKYLSTRF